MESGFRIVSSSVAGYTYPVSWRSEAIDVKALGGDGGVFHIIWEDWTLTFYLWAYNYPAFVTSPPAHDWTAEYRAIDPAWADPNAGDPRSEHPVRWKNLGFRYVAIGWTGGAVGAAPYLQIFFARDRYIK